jgi:hypothetical protein
MNLRVFLTLAAVTTALLAPGPASAQNKNLPKGSYQQSCTCQVSGGTTLLCMCANPQGKYFQTDFDVRNCSLPKDIRNCFGKLICVDPKGASAAALGGECDPATMKPGG